MSKRKSKKIEKKCGSKMLSISMILFVIFALIALYLILNKGKIGNYSLIKIETLADSEEESAKEPEKKLEMIAEKKYLSSKKKEKTALSILLEGEELDINEVELTSSDENVIKIKEGMAVASSVGKATITAKKDNLETSIDLRVIIPITSITFSSTSSTVKVGKPSQMKLVTKPSDASIETLKYESSDEEIATVNSNGIVTGVAPGKVTITVRDTYSGIEKKVNLTIKK